MNNCRRAKRCCHAYRMGRRRRKLQRQLWQVNPAEELRKQARQQAGAQADRILNSTRLQPKPSAESQKSFARDTAMALMYQWATNRGKTGKTTVYTYLFTHPQPGATKERYQTFHSSEWPYIFDNLKQTPRPWTAEDAKIARQCRPIGRTLSQREIPMGRDWGAVASTFREIPDETMELGDTMGPRPVRRILRR